MLYSGPSISSFTFRCFSLREKIFLQKVDSSQLMGVNLSMEMASKCIMVVEDLAYLLLRLPFGGHPCPSLWRNFSLTITDLGTAITNDSSCDPEELHSPLQGLIPTTISAGNDVPFGQALPMATALPPGEGTYKADVFIDDVISVVFDDEQGCKKGAAETLLAIHAIAWPITSLEPVARDELTAENSREEAASKLSGTSGSRELVGGDQDHPGVVP
jgi:hypothetical protein